MARGRAARRAIDPVVFAAYLDAHSTYVRGGHPVRLRRCINGMPVTQSDLRVIRRWRSGINDGVAIRTAETLLHRYGLAIVTFKSWAKANNRNPVIRGGLPS